MFTFLNHLVIDAGLGLSPDQPLELRTQVFRDLFSDTPMGETRRARAFEVANTQRTEFQAHDLEIGFAYLDGAVIPDGSQAPPRDPMGSVYYPTSRPGHRLPHAWLEHQGQKLSTHDLTGTGTAFVLITGAQGQDWVSAADVAEKKFGIRIKAVTIADGAEYTDPTGRWNELREIGEDGAILVRPDNHVAWRSAVHAADPTDDLTRTVAALLSR